LGPVISVIIPTYCEEKTIEGCLESVKNQDFEENKIEIIVVDSNSPDNTRAIAKKYTEKVLDLKDRGVGKARNAGAEMAESETLLFLDADTILEYNFLTEMFHTFADPRVVCASGTVVGLERLGVMGNLFVFLHYGFMNKVAALTARLGFPLFPAVCCACRKSVFDEVGGFAEDLAVAEDLAFSRKMGRVGKCVVNKEARAYTSVRRIKKCGLARMYLMYFGNYFKIFVLNHRAWIQDFPHVREM
jgi:glycosyltransferase involved in cell wall biosynthesis